MGGSGDPLADCLSFNELLAATSGALDALLPALRAQDEALTALEADLRDGLRGLDADLEGFEHAVQEGGALVLAASRDLEHAATTGADSAAALEAAASQAEEAASRDLDQAGTRLEERFLELAGAPFDALEHALGEETAEFTQALTDAQPLAGVLARAVEATAESVANDANDDQTGLDDARSQADDDANLVAGSSADPTTTGSYLAYSFPDEIERSFETQAESFTGVLDAWEQRLDAEAALLQSSAASLAESAGQALAEDARRLRDSVAGLVREWQAMRIEVEQTTADLEAAGPALEAAAAQASRIGEIQGRIDWIQQVVDAMDTK